MGRVAWEGLRRVVEGRGGVGWREGEEKSLVWDFGANLVGRTQDSTSASPLLIDDCQQPRNNITRIIDKSVGTKSRNDLISIS